MSLAPVRTVVEARPVRSDFGVVSIALFSACMLAAATAAAVAPSKVALALIGATGLAICLARIEAALLVLVATFPLESAYHLTSSNTLSTTKLAGGICTLSLLVTAIRHRRQLRWDHTLTIITLLLGLALISSTHAVNPGEGLSTALRYASFVGFFFVVAQLDDHRDLGRRISWTLTLAGAFAAYLAIVHFLHGTDQAQPRYDNPNDLAFVLACTLPLTIWLVTQGRIATRIVAALAAALIATEVMLSFSRGALLGLAAGLVWHGLSERRHRRALTVAAAITAVVALVFARVDPAPLHRGLQSKSHVAQHNVNYRIVAYQKALQLAADHPLMGVGPGNFREYYYELTGSPPGTENLGVTHDSYLDVACELGFVGLVLFLGYIALTFRRLNRAVRERAGPPGLASFVRTALIVALVGMLTHTEEYFAPIWLCGALAVQMLGRDKGDSDAAPARP